jgi:micrococcal nuclease
MRAALPLFVLACGAPCGPPQALVTRVVDGDTVVLENGDRVRYLNIDAPEDTGSHHDCFGAEATAFNRETVEGRDVSLEYDDVACKDRYDRWLAWLFVGGLDVSAEEVKQGYACAYLVPPAGSARAVEFDDDQSVAKTERLGLWGACEAVICR